jgi:mRNA-degrading endonuclease toxin of MazEF toxin-antitoxin module
MAGCSGSRARADLKRGDIYLVSLDPALGHEQQGTRPVLVLTQEAFNKLTHTPIVAAITNGGDFARRAGFTMTVRNGRRLEAVPAEIMDEVLARVSTLLE